MKEISLERMPAGDLNREHIGHKIQFNWRFPDSMARATVIATLREVAHLADNTTTVVVSGTPTGPQGAFNLGLSSNGVAIARERSILGG